METPGAGRTYVDKIPDLRSLFDKVFSEHFGHVIHYVTGLARVYTLCLKKSIILKKNDNRKIVSFRARSE